MKIRFFASLPCLGFLLAASQVDAETLSKRLEVDTRLPVYLNNDEAELVFVRRDSAETLSLALTITDEATGYVPYEPAKLVLSGEANRFVKRICIADWPDGEYRVVITDVENKQDALHRAIRKQTQVAPQAPDGPFDVRGTKLFFPDDWRIDSISGLQRVIHPAELIAIEPEGVDESFYQVNNRIDKMWFAEDGTFYAKMASGSMEQPDKRFWVRSEDLQNWQIVESPATAAQALTTTRLREQEPRARPGDRLPPDTRVEHYDPERDGPVRLEDIVIRYSGFDRNPEWDGIPVTSRSRIPLWLESPGRALLLREAITQDKLHWSDDDIGEWRDSNDNFGEPRMTADSSRLRMFQSRRIPRHDPFKVIYDNIHADRIMVTWTTADGLTWEPTYFSAPDLNDPWSTQHYGVDLWWEENNELEFAYKRFYDVQRQRLYVELVYSRDGFYWNRFSDKPFMDNGAPKSWNFGYTITPPSRENQRERLEWQDHYYEAMVGINVLHFMFLQAQGARNQISVERFARIWDGRMMGERGVENSPIMQWYDDWQHIADETVRQRFTSGLARFRKDGWVSLAPNQRRGEFTTQPFLIGDAITMNARTVEAGFVLVEILDQHGNPLPEFSGINAASFRGDAARQTLAWPAGDLQTINSDPVRLRVSIVDGELFTLQF